MKIKTKTKTIIIIIIIIIEKIKEHEELMERLFLEEMDEETYNNLDAQKRKEIDDKLLVAKKLRLKRQETLDPLYLLKLDAIETSLNNSWLNLKIHT
jgi:hypothetical protein